ncbi:MAG: hypothetical protein M8354_03625 [Halalkalicoccus sp.]|nr:hypothetical protein [Halalkalicoccus sp.]
MSKTTPPSLGDDDPSHETDTLSDREAWEVFCRTGCIVPGYASVIAQRMRQRREAVAEAER